MVLGSGIAGLCAALAASESTDVILLCKGALHDSNTFYAQGGIAAPTPDPNDAESHINDTLRVACGLANSSVVDRIIRQAPAAIDKLIDWGVAFDRSGGELARTREGGHSRSRVLHARGDATGLELSAVLSAAAKENPRIRILEHHFAVDLIRINDRCVGIAAIQSDGSPVRIFAGAVIFATGGAGEVYRHTTNPPGATADGAAMALRAGVILRDMEFMQFHPTALAVGVEPLPLVSEALRGEGARLVDRSGRRFMEAHHPELELAPRDVVSRAIFAELSKSGDASVYLDVRHWPADFMSGRFPNIRQVCLHHGIDPASVPIPVRPAAHYMIGGLNVDQSGSTSLPGLYACGEASSSGMHGANRLASNSLLEALVLGDVCGREAACDSAPGEIARHRQAAAASESQVVIEPGRLQEARNLARNAMWDHVGIVRTEPGLRGMEPILDHANSILKDAAPTPRVIETLNIITTAMAMTSAALARTESRGVHFRSDFPERNDTQWQRHIDVQCLNGRLEVRQGE